MSAAASLRILLFRNTEDTDIAPFEQAIVRAFLGGKEAGGYLAAGDDLGVQLEVFSEAPPADAPVFLDSFCHTLVLVLADRALIEKSDHAVWTWLSDCWKHVGASGKRHGMLAFPMDERVWRDVLKTAPNLQWLQTRAVHEYGEFGVRSAMVALRALHEARLLLARGLDPSATSMRLFISHAKVDGLPLAQAMTHQIDRIGWLSSFYDAKDLPEGSDWAEELETGVGSSIIVMLRTDSYDSRHWCRQEVLWADEYATPAVLVDARTSLSHPANALPFDRVPTVRIPDGNLLRVLFFALREALRFLLFARRVEEMKRLGELPAGAELRVFSVAPSMAALLRACRSFTPGVADRYILYPDPPLPPGTAEAAEALVAMNALGVRLTTPDNLAATAGSVP